MDQLASMRAFVTVVNTQSFTKAADLLQISKPALSRAISDLESHIGSKILNRTTRRVSLAETAKDYYDACSRIIDELAQAERRLSDDKVSECGSVRVVIHPLAVAAGMSNMLDAFSTTAPCIKLHVSVQGDVLNLVESGYDVSIYPPERISNSTVVNRPLFHSRYVLVASPQYLRRTAPVKSICELSEHRIIDGRDDVSGKAGGVVMETDVCATFSLRGAHFDVPGVIARELALAGAGIALLPEVAVRRDIAKGQLRQVGLGGEMSLGGVDLGVQYQQSSSTPRRTKTFIDACLGYFRSLDVEQETSSAQCQ